MFSFFKRKHEESNREDTHSVQHPQQQQPGNSLKAKPTLRLALRGQRGTGKTVLSNLLRGFDFSSSYLPSQQITTQTCQFFSLRLYSVFLHRLFSLHIPYR